MRFFIELRPQQKTLIVTPPHSCCHLHRERTVIDLAERLAGLQ